MSLNMERFTRLAEEAIYLSHRIVSDAQQQKMEAEHLLVSLLRQGEGPLPQVFGQLKVNVKELREELERYIGQLDPAAGPGKDVYLSYSCEQCIRKAEYEADRMRDEFLGPEHLVLGILANTGTEASTILPGQGLDLKSLTKTIEAFRGGKRITSRGGNPAELENVNLYCRDFVALARENKFDPG